MQITISGHHIEVTPAIRSHVEERLSKVLAHFDEVVTVKVTLILEKHKEKDGQRAECSLHVKGDDLFAEAVGGDLYASIDEMLTKLDRQVLRHKEKMQGHGKETAKRSEIL